MTAKTWRPDGWNTEEVTFSPLHCLAPQQCADHFFEAGADAILEALRKTGTHEEHCYVGKNGTYVFIPDDPPEKESKTSWLHADGTAVDDSQILDRGVTAPLTASPPDHKKQKEFGIHPEAVRVCEELAKRADFPFTWEAVQRILYRHDYRGYGVYANPEHLRIMRDVWKISWILHPASIVTEEGYRCDKCGKWVKSKIVGELVTVSTLQGYPDHQCQPYCHPSEGMNAIRP